jgi:hypothetical protein
VRSLSETARLRLTAVLLAVMLGCGTDIASGQSGTIDDAEIARALDVVKSDPLITPDRTFKTLKWRDAQPSQRSSTPAWMTWIAGLFTWLGQSARYLVWAAAAVLVFLVVRYVVAAVRPHVTLAGDQPLAIPTYVRDLDIRPESLPDDIGAAARALWDDGQPRAALALLYRGLLSRLAHVDSLPIRDSTTEGDCLALTAAHLTPTRRDYASRLIRVWQRAVYGREAIEGVMVHDLCDRFDAAMNLPPIRYGRPESGA